MTEGCTQSSPTDAYAYLRPQKRICALKQQEAYSDRSGKLSVRNYSNLAIRPMGQVAGIEPTASRFIDDCDYYAEIIDVVNKDATTCISGKVLYAGYMRNSWGHFLMNSTSRLWPLFTDNGNYDKIIFFAQDGKSCSLKGNFKEFLELAGLIDRVEVLPDGVYLFENLSVPEVSLEMGRYYSSEFMLPFVHVREKALSGIPSDGKYKGIVLARSHWNGNDRMQINIKWVEEIFTSRGYCEVHPESTGLARLVRLMADAEVTVTPSGSTAHNRLFNPEGKWVVIERCAVPNFYQTAISLMCKGKTVFVDAFLQPLLSSSSDNLTIYGATPQFEAFALAEAFTLIPPKTVAVKEFSQYLKIYRSHYGYAPGLNEWETEQLPAITEAWFASRQRYTRLLSQRVPLFWYDWFSPRIMFRFLRDKLKRQ